MKSEKLEFGKFNINYTRASLSAPFEVITTSNGYLIRKLGRHSYAVSELGYLEKSKGWDKDKIDELVRILEKWEKI